MYLNTLTNERKICEKKDLDFQYIWVFLAFILMLIVPSKVLGEDKDAASHRTANAVRIRGAPPQLDGILDDEIRCNIIGNIE